jgi:hypothetical protein
VGGVKYKKSFKFGWARGACVFVIEGVSGGSQIEKIEKLEIIIYLFIYLFYLFI